SMLTSQRFSISPHRAQLKPEISFSPIDVFRPLSKQQNLGCTPDDTARWQVLDWTIACSLT
ncbi:MAG: hypothetical protein ACKV2Q_27410, partial [Planctomycetaceae bacterium]